MICDFGFLGILYQVENSLDCRSHQHVILKMEGRELRPNDLYPAKKRPRIATK